MSTLQATYMCECGDPIDIELDKGAASREWYLAVIHKGLDISVVYFRNMDVDDAVDMIRRNADWNLDQSKIYAECSWKWSEV